MQEQLRFNVLKLQSANISYFLYSSTIQEEITFGNWGLNVGCLGNIQNSLMSKSQERKLHILN